MAGDWKVKLEVRYTGNKSGAIEKFVVAGEPSEFKDQLAEVIEKRSGVLRFLEEDGSEVVIMMVNVLRFKIRTEAKGKPKRKIKRTVKKKGEDSGDTKPPDAE